MKAKEVSLVSNFIYCNDLPCGRHLFETCIAGVDYLIEIERNAVQCRVAVWEYFEAPNGHVASRYEDRCKLGSAWLGVNAVVTPSLVADFNRVADAFRTIRAHNACLGVKIDYPVNRV